MNQWISFYEYFVNGPWPSPPHLWGGCADILILWHAAGQYREEWQPWRASAGRVRGRANLRLVYILDPHLFNFSKPSSLTHPQRCLQSHSSSGCQPHEFTLIAPHFHIQDFCMYELSTHVVYRHLTSKSITAASQLCFFSEYSAF